MSSSQKHVVIQAEMQVALGQHLTTGRGTAITRALFWWQEQLDPGDQNTE